MNGVKAFRVEARRAPLFVRDWGAQVAIVCFRSALPRACVESMPGAVHDLVTYAPAKVTQLVGSFVATPSSG